MSRSHKRNPICKDSTRKGPTFKSGKQIANRNVRHVPDLPNGGGYRKAFCSYNISDYLFRMEEKELKQEWEMSDSWIRRRFMNYKQAYRWWLKNYRNK